MSKKLAIVIPCRNEAESIAEVISGFPIEQLSKQNIAVKIYVVDNNSSDETASIARKMGAAVLFEPQAGKGNAMRTGFNSIPSDFDYVVMVDGDSTYSSEEVLRMVEPLRNDFCDVVVGTRLGGKINSSAMSLTSRLGNRVFTLAARLFYRTNVSDVLTGYFAWKKSALDQIKPFITSNGFAIEMEMITKMARLRLQMASVPISYNPRLGQSHLHPLKDGWRILVMLLRNLAWRPHRPPGKMRKIVFVSDAIYPYMKGGKEKRLHEIAKRLAAMGNDVHIYTMHWWAPPQKVITENGVKLHALCKYYPMYNGHRRAIKEGILFGLSCLKLLGVSFDVLDVDHMPFFPIFSSWLVCLLRRRKMHATWHEALTRQEWVNYMGRSGLVANLLERLSIRLPHRITAASVYTKEKLAAVHGRVERVETVASGIDADLLQSVEPARTDCDVLYVGRLVKDKNVDKLIAAVAKVRKVKPDVRCIIIGQGPEEAYLKQMVDKKSLQQNVIFLAPLPEAKDIYSYMKAARVFCSPSIREGFGIVSLEALACGTPVITIGSPHNAARFLVENGKNGSVVPLTTNALATSILKWVGNVQKSGPVISTDEYDWRHIAQKQAEVYSQ